MANFGPLAAEIGSGVWGTPGKFQRASRLAFVSAATHSSEANQTLFGRLLGWYTIYTFLTALAPDGISPLAKFT